MNEIKDAIRDLMVQHRRDIVSGVCSTKDAISILGVSREYLYDMLRDPNTKLIPSRIKGRYSLKSVHDEFERIHGFKYKEAVVQ